MAATSLLLVVFMMTVRRHCFPALGRRFWRGTFTFWTHYRSPRWIRAILNWESMSVVRSVCCGDRKPLDCNKRRRVGRNPPSQVTSASNSSSISFLKPLQMLHNIFVTQKTINASPIISPSIFFIFFRETSMLLIYSRVLVCVTHSSFILWWLW